MTLTDLESAGFDVHAVNHARAVLENDFPQTVREMCEILLNFTISAEELVRPGGAEAPSTKRLKNAFESNGWPKREVKIGKTVDGEEKESTSHIIDHVRPTEAGSVALEIEWNSKDTSFDRDLDTFQRLHHEGAISVGVIVTRGSSFQNEVSRIILGFATNRNIRSFDQLSNFGYRPTDSQRDQIVRRLAGSDFATEWSRVFVNSKFATSTTHWGKLQARIMRGVGNPCPLLLLGIPAQSVQEDP